MRFHMSTGFAALMAVAQAFAFSAPASAGEAYIAVAANFAEVTELLAQRFEKKTGHKLRVTTGSSGKLYAQISNGAPFDVFLSADQERPKRLEQEGKTVAGSRFAYATGQLSLWSADPKLIGTSGPATLRQAGFRSLAIANPKLAPYGLAAREALKALKLWRGLQNKIVMGQNVGQTFALIASGNAELGMVARSFVISRRNKSRGSRWDVPSSLHSPVLQDAVLLSRAADNPAALAFLQFLKSQETIRVIRQFGYGVN